MPAPPEARDEVWPISHSRQRLSIRHTHVEIERFAAYHLRRVAHSVPPSRARATALVSLSVGASTLVLVGPGGESNGRQFDDTRQRTATRDDHVEPRVGASLRKEAIR